MKSDYKSFIRKIWRMVDSKEPIDCFYERYKFFLIDLYHAEGKIVTGKLFGKIRLPIHKKQFLINQKIL